MFLRIHFILLASFASLSAVSSFSHADIISKFDSGSDGWTSTSGVSWQSSGGNSGGYLQFIDSGPADGGQIIAPAAFLGDWTRFENGALSFDFAVFQTQTPTFNRGVRIAGSGGVANWRGPNLGGLVDWTPLAAPIKQAEWSVISGNWNSLLANVTELRIFMADSSVAVERTGIDNIRLSAVTEPASSVLLLVGTCLVVTKRHRPRTRALCMPQLEQLCDNRRSVG